MPDKQTIEHLDGLFRACARKDDRLAYDAARCEQLAARLRRNGTWLVSTDVVFEDPVGVNLESRMPYVPSQGAWVPRNPPARTVNAATRRTMRAVRRFLAGTDMSIQRPRIVPGFSLHDELMLFVQQGHTSAEALQAATVNAARFMGRTEEFGTIQPSRRADLVLFDADPLADIRNSSRMAAVVMNGRLFDRAALDHLLASAANAVKKIDLKPPPMLSLVIAGGGSPFAGVWEAVFPNLGQPFVFDLRVEGGVVTGVVRGGVQTLLIEQGAANERTISFAAKLPDAGRTLIFMGELDGNEIKFTRRVNVAPGGLSGGAGFLGTSGATPSRLAGRTN